MENQDVTPAPSYWKYMPADVQPVYPQFNTGPNLESGPESGLTEESGADYSGDKEEEEGWSDSSTGKLSIRPSHRESGTESGNESGSLSGHANSDRLVCLCCLTFVRYFSARFVQ